MPRQCTCRLDLGAHDALELVGRTLDVVVDDDVVEVVRLVDLASSQREPLADLAGALGRPLAQAALELVEARGDDEDRDRGRPHPLHVLRALRLELEDAAPAGRQDPVDLRS